MKNKTLAELNEQYKDYPTNSATYEIDGKFYTVTAHFVGKKNLDEIIYRNAFEKAFAEIKKQAEKNADGIRRQTAWLEYFRHLR